MSEAVLSNLCQIFPENKDFDIKIVGGAMHSLLFPDYKSGDVDLHFIPKKNKWEPYKELVDCFNNMKDPFVESEVQKTLEYNSQVYFETLNRLVPLPPQAPPQAKFNRKMHVMMGNPMIVREVDLADSYFLIMQEITLQMTIDPVNSINVPMIFTLDAYHTLLRRNYEKFIAMAFRTKEYSTTVKIQIDKNNSWTVKEMFDILSNTQDVNARWLGYCKWCNGAFHNPILHDQLKLDPNRKFILSVVIEKNYQSIELDRDHLHWFFRECDMREALILALLTFHNEPQPHFDAIIDSSLYTPVHLSDPYKMERLRMYYTGVPTDNMLHKINFDTSQAYARELLMRSLPYCHFNNFTDAKFKKIISRIKDLGIDDFNVCTDTKNIYDSIMRLAKLENTISQKKYVCSLKRSNRSLDR
jgi:hypothetical protein